MAADLLPKCGTPRCPNTYAFRLSDGLVHCYDCHAVIPDPDRRVATPAPTVGGECSYCQGCGTFDCDEGDGGDCPRCDRDAFRIVPPKPYQPKPPAANAKERTET